MGSTRHQLLQSQLQDLIGENADIPAPFQALLQQVSDSYTRYENDHAAIESKFALRTEQLIVSTSNAYSFLDSLNMGFIMCDVNGEVVLSNSSVRQLLSSGLTTPVDQTEWSLETIHNLVQPQLQLKKLIQQCLSNGQSLECDDINYGKHVLQFYLAPLINETSKDNKQQLGVVILVEDITEQKVLERSKDEFLSIASHELRTPLTAIRGNAYLIKKYYADKLPDKDVTEIIDDIHESSGRLIGIVNDFLDVAAIEQGKISMTPTTFLPGEIINDVVRELQHLCDSKGVALISQPDVSSAPAVSGDKQRVKQVIYNLVGNATKFTDNGSITISTKTNDNFVYTTVTDTGRGMSTENQRLLFRKFQQAGSSLLTRDTTKGTGLGLYISKLIVELSGGKLNLVRSELNEGSSFEFSLPRATATTKDMEENSHIG